MSLPKPASTPSVKNIARNWISIPQPVFQNSHKFRFMTWNLLAQCLVRQYPLNPNSPLAYLPRTGRELFPTSNCLKAAQREPLIFQEIRSNNADLMCLQEVDRLDRLQPFLDDLGYAFQYAAGPNKKHGLMIAYKKSLFILVDQHTVQYDDYQFESARGGVSYRTTNIGFVVALKLTTGDAGVVVATSHLFWHPRYAYERARQAGILMQESLSFRKKLKLLHWPSIIAGGWDSGFSLLDHQCSNLWTWFGADFNFSPADPEYSLIVGDSLLPEQESRVEQSRVIHQTIDPNVKTTIASESAGDPDKVIQSARAALPEDGLLTSNELASLFSASVSCSAYDNAMSIALSTAPEEIKPLPQLYSSISPARRGRYEPLYTAYTFHWKNTLDYIFLQEGTHFSWQVTAVLQTPHSDSLEPGLPQKDVCGSDHISLVVELSMSASPVAQN